MVRSRWITREDELSTLAGEWSALMQRAAAPQPVLTPTWLLAWWRAFGRLDGRRLAALTLRDADSDRLVGLVPMLERRARHARALPLRRLELLASGEDEADEICSDYLGALFERDRLSELARATTEALVARASEWDELVMPGMEDGSPTVDALEAAFRSAGMAVNRSVTGECPFTTLPASWEAWLESLDGQRRYFVRRTLRDFEKWAGPGGGELHRASTPDELIDGRAVLARLHGERWSEGGVFRSEVFSRFHREVMERFRAGDGADLDLLWLTVRGEPVAALYNIVYGNKVYFYQSGRKIDVPKGVRPGIVIHLYAMQRAIAAGIREYDFLNGATPYKRQLASGTRALITLRAVSPSLRGRSVEAARKLMATAADEVKRHPWGKAALRATAQVRARHSTIPPRSRSTPPGPREDS
jgi:CelD/BcsL family acetyltransferase involved in cellulose biosynthesis